jgi:hypothetical protein
MLPDGPRADPERNGRPPLTDPEHNGRPLLDDHAREQPVPKSGVKGNGAPQPDGPPNPPPERNCWPPPADTERNGWPPHDDGLPDRPERNGWPPPTDPKCNGPPPPDDRAWEQPGPKSGFEGKRATNMFGRYAKRSGDRKLINTPTIDVPIGANNMESNVLQRTRSTTAGRKVTKMQIIPRLGIATRSCREAQKQNEETLSHDRSLMKKVSKSKDVVEELRTCLKGARQEVRSCWNS